MRNSIRVRSAIVAVLAASLVLTTVIAPVTAATPQQVSIVSKMIFPGDGPNYGTFKATGSAVGSGLICDSGAVLDLGYVFGGSQSGQKVQIRVDKEFTCKDGSGTILVTIEVHANFDGTETFTWVVQGGTGAYEHLRGSGDGYSIPLRRGGGNTNYYEGNLVG